MTKPNRIGGDGSSEGNSRLTFSTAALLEEATRISKPRRRGSTRGAHITPTGTLRYTFDAGAKGANLTGTANPVQVMLTIGGDSGATSVTAEISH
ncbi:MAG: hypothetical protein WA624_22100 [Methylocella sp.]